MLQIGLEISFGETDLWMEQTRSSQPQKQQFSLRDYGFLLVCHSHADIPYLSKNPAGWTQSQNPVTISHCPEITGDTAAIIWLTGIEFNLRARGKIKAKPKPFFFFLLLIAR